MDLPNPGIELGSPELQVDSSPTELSGKFREEETHGVSIKKYRFWGGGDGIFPS